MSTPLTRGFSTTSRAAIKFGGKVGLNDIVAQNPGNGEKLKSAVVDMAETLEKIYPKIVEGQIQGAKAHTSSKDPNETQKVITVGFYSVSGTRMLSGHAREDGNFSHWLSRAGRTGSK
ncbi:hypothetical protein I7I53_11531 [Histoplasma capsulatum var. duboisii H88]|uniref:Uncharacterized protein n=1 Tax=Ajellomyces capsulatus (strain H88) TaxID=544711 RepID=A0A8A1LTX2_AJEC8|nr:hypothetical protein I7I53_11531 [Histoplasma capsulatum var. duboisii H88]